MNTAMSRKLPAGLRPAAISIEADKKRTFKTSSSRKNQTRRQSG